MSEGVKLKKKILDLKRALPKGKTRRRSAGNDRDLLLSERA